MSKIAERIWRRVMEARTYPLWTDKERMATLKLIDIELTPFRETIRRFSDIHEDFHKKITVELEATYDPVALADVWFYNKALSGGALSWSMQCMDFEDLSNLYRELKTEGGE